MRSENARNASKKHNEGKVLRYVQNGGLLDLKAYLKKRGGKMDINFHVNKVSTVTYRMQTLKRNAIHNKKPYFLKEERSVPMSACGRYFNSTLIRCFLSGRVSTMAHF